MRFGLSVPNFGEFGDVHRLADLAAEAESLGWDGFFTWDHLIHPWPGAGPTVDATVVLTAVAIATEQIRFGPMVTPVSRRRPVKLTRELTTLDRLSGGRLVFGVGLGDAAQEFGDLGESADYKVRAAMLDEGLDLMAALATGEKVDHHGRYYTASTTQLDPATMQQPRIPVWVGGTWPRSGPLNRAARWDGYLPLKQGGAITAEDVRAMAAALDVANRPGYALAVTDYGDGAAGPAESAAAGATWWIQSTAPWNQPAEVFLAALRRGPQR
jgi:alkanesulfonate monooxygenase SsuD/methylene tetrahydromethanopterin reductase-like flavin-dependent oxidoreductase (luciferase family)